MDEQQNEKEQASFEESLSDEQRKKMAGQITELGGQLHDEWRAPRKQEDGTFEPRIKTTKDQAWIEKNGTDQIDIANNSYENLPEDWKGENKASAEVAIPEIYKAISEGKELDDQFIEETSDIIHQKWLERNGSWAPAEQNKPYAELSEEEKEKDRAIVRKAVETYKENATN